LLQAGEIMQVQVLELWEFQHAVWIPLSYSLMNQSASGVGNRTKTEPNHPSPPTSKTNLIWTATSSQPNHIPTHGLTQ
jgi:hypothetical protein